MTKHTNYDYLQVKITTTLETTSLLHCGDGGTLEGADWNPEKNNNKQKEGRINTLCKAQNGEPYIPATTLRGSLRDRYKKEDKEVLFGSSHEKGAAGKIRLYDAICKSLPRNYKDQYQHETSKTTLQEGVAINPVTQTAKAHQLYTHEIVPIGTNFKLAIEADRITQTQLEHIIEILQHWNNNLSSAIGKGRSKGWGKLKINEQINIELLTDEAIKNWINENTPEAKWQKEKRSLSLNTSTKKTSLTFNLFPKSPLLINDHSRVKDAKEVPDLEFMRTADNKAIIPGSTLKGATRAHAHRIMASIAHLHYNVDATKAANLVETSLNELFGAERQRSLLWFSDAIDQADKASKKHPQLFNAVDRFTGGVAEGALFNVVAANCEQLSGECTYDTRPQRQPKEKWWKGLLLLMIRDFMEGELAIGWGKGKGYGQVDLTLNVDNTHYTTFEALLSYLETTYQTDGWIEQLHQHIDQLAKQEV